MPCGLALPRYQVRNLFFNPPSRLKRSLSAYALLLVVVAALWWSLADFETVSKYTGAAPPRLAAVPPDAGTPTRVALVLGGGGPRGFAHVGVLKAFEAAGIVPDIIVGPSMGALIGALYAAKPDAAALEALILDTDISPSVGDLTLTTRPWLKGNQIEQLLRDQLGLQQLQALRIPMVVVATDVSSGVPVAFSSGDAVTAVRASTAVPGTFKRILIEGREYFDGDITAPVPVSLTRALGARVIIAVDVMCHPAEMLEVMRDSPDLIMSDFYRHAINLRELPGADIVISPRLGYYAGFSRKERQRFIAIGEAAAKKAIPAIRQRLEANPS